MYVSKMLFAENHMGNIIAAYTFESRIDVENFLKRVDLSKDQLFTVLIETDKEHVHIVDIMKAGYGKYLFHMMDNIPMISESMH